MFKNRLDEVVTFYLSRLFFSLASRPSLRLKIGLMAASTFAYVLGIIFLTDEDRGYLTTFLYSSYMVVGISFLGSETLLAYFGRGPYRERLALATTIVLPGLLCGLVIGVSGLAAIYFLPADGAKFGLYLLLFGIFVSVSVLGAVIFAAKASSAPHRIFWQHYSYITALLVGMVAMLITSRVTLLQFVLVYILSSVPFLFFSWSAVTKQMLAARVGTERKVIDRRESRRLFVGTFASNMLLRAVGVLVALVYGPAYLGQYVVLWLAFEAVGQLYGYYLLSDVYLVGSKEPGERRRALSHRLRVVIFIGIPVVIIVGLAVGLVAPLLSNYAGGDLATTLILLTAHYSLRLILGLLLNFLRATGQILQATKIEVFNTFTAIVLVTWLPSVLGFPGVAAGLLFGTLLASAWVGRKVYGVR